MIGDGKAKRFNCLVTCFEDGYVILVGQIEQTQVFVVQEDGN